MTETAKLTASDAVDADNFGRSVSISGDWAIVGAYQSDDSGTDSGSAYLFKKPIAGWTNMTETKEITGSDTEAGDNFGDSISIDGNYALVGAPAEDGAGLERGAAYVFYKDEGSTDNWGQQAKLTAGDIQDDWLFAIHKLSISGNYAAVGCMGNNDNGSGAGAVYIYNKDEGGTDNWGQQAKLTASDGAADDNLGYSASMYGDTVIAGAKGDDSGAGSAYIFGKPGTGWQNMTETEKISAGDGSSNDQFGYETSISGNYNIVGAPTEDDEGRTDSGAAYIFESSSSSIVPEFKDFIYILTILAAISMMYKNIPQYSYNKI
ncbi:hypothetical protein GF366_03170 [Candidatus Peregrinibacteria bacterium]|nr:hypothetical protein [Candidatus Peregrinibacteria bacterium]